MITIPPSERNSIDEAIDRATARIAKRASTLSPSMVTLADAIERALTGGKRLRPALVVATYSSVVPPERPMHPALYEVAAAFEVLHAAFVVHDDVIDHDVVRRGIPNVAGEFRLRAMSAGADFKGASQLGDAAAILAGDLLLHEATRMIALAELTAGERHTIFELFDEAVVVSAAGELADVEHSIAADHPAPEALLEAAHDKTAVYTFSAPLRAGAILAGVSDQVEQLLGEQGARLGLAFQLIDDLIGTFGTADQAGKDAGADLREAKRTPLTALARNTTVWPAVSEAIERAWTGPVAIKEAQQALVDSGARDTLAHMIITRLTETKEAARELPASLGVLVDQLVDALQERIPK